MGGKEAGQLVAAGAEGIKEGSAAWADGVVPYYDPFEKVYANSDGSIDNVYKFSRAMGHVSRDAAIAAYSSPGNLGAYVKNPIQYEVGSIAMTNANYAKYGLKGLSAVQKGSVLIAEHGGGALGAVRAVKNLTHLGKGAQLIGTGLTPGAGILAIGLFEGADIVSGGNSSKK